MLETYGLHEIVWNAADQAIGGELVASSNDVRGRGIALTVREGGAAANLTGATAYLVWCHRATGERGTVAFDAVNAAEGAFRVYYPGTMCSAAGAVDAQIMLSLGGGRYISTRTFVIRVERVVVDELEPADDGFSLFVEAMQAYANAESVTTAAAAAANQAVADLQAAVARGDFDGADGISPTATVTQTGTGATITVTDRNGTTTADITRGVKGDKGDTGPQGPKGDKGDKGDTGDAGPQGETGATGATGAQGAKGDKGDDGDDGFSPTVAVASITGGHRVTITDANGHHAFDVYDGSGGGGGGSDGITPTVNVSAIAGGHNVSFYYGEDDARNASFDVMDGSDGAVGATGATGAQGPKGDKGDKGDTGAAGPKGDTGETGATGPAGADGADGSDGNDGVSCTHSWSGTVLSVTSASGTSSADLVGPQGPKGDTGETGATGPAGADGTVFTPQSPLSLSNGVLSVDLSGCASSSDLPPKLWVSPFVPAITEYSSGATSVSKSSYPGLKSGDYMWNTLADTLVKLGNVSESAYSYSITYEGMVDLSKVRGILVTTDIDLAPGVTGSANVSANGHSVNVGTLLLNTASGNLMNVTAKATPDNGATAKVRVSAVGLANIFNANVSGGGATYTAASPLSIDSNDEISIDLSGYAALSGATFTGAVTGITPTSNNHLATKKYVDDAIAALTNLDTEQF